VKPADAGNGTKAGWSGSGQVGIATRDCIGYIRVPSRRSPTGGFGMMNDTSDRIEVDPAGVEHDQGSGIRDLRSER
jgi:hypothetical protein